MKRILILSLFILTGCGVFESSYDSMNYESLTNEIGDVMVLSGGKIVVTYDNAKIIYSNSDTQAMWVKWKDNNYYIQGDVIIKLK